MSRNTARMIGLLTMLVSVFFILGGLYLQDAGLPKAAAPASLAIGLILLAAGIVFYRIIKSE